MNESQRKFLKNEFFMPSWGAAVQHNGVWNKNTTNKEKGNFRIEIKKILEDKLSEVYSKRKVTEEEHIANIEELQAKTKELGNALNFGTCQKLLNMMCKYYWCIGLIKEQPPLLPVDRINLQNAEIKDCNWTQIEDKNEYKSIIDKIRKKAGSQSLAEWEIVNWERKQYREE